MNAKRTFTSALLAAALVPAAACGGSGDPAGRGTSNAVTAASSPASAGGPTTNALQGSGSPQAAMAAVEAAVKDRMENPGMQVYIAQGAVELNREFGVASYSPPRPMVKSDRLMVASVTKPFIATAAMRLVEQGKLTLGDPAERYLGGLIRPGTGITVEDLLSMRSGLPDYGEAAGYTGPGTMTSAQLLALVKPLPLVDQPGTTTTYNNTNYAALGVVLEKVTGRHLVDVVDELVIRPAGLERTSLGGDPTARGYAAAYDGAKDITPRYRYVSASNGIVSSATDLGRFLRALLAGELVSKATLELMTRPRGEMEDGGYGLGLTRYATPCGTAIGHFGKNEAYAAAAFVLPTNQRVVAVTANSGANDTLQLVVLAKGLCG